jgi:hypothetical protein
MVPLRLLVLRSLRAHQREDGRAIQLPPVEVVPARTHRYVTLDKLLIEAGMVPLRL